MQHIPYTPQDFSLPDEKSALNTLNNFRGKRLVLYFYPKGNVQKIYGQATPVGHGEKVINDLKELQLV